MMSGGKSNERTEWVEGMQRMRMDFRRINLKGMIDRFEVTLDFLFISLWVHII